MQSTSDHEDHRGGSGPEASPLIDDAAPLLSAQRAGEDPPPVPPPHRPPPETPETEIIPTRRTGIMPDEGEDGPPGPPPAPQPDPTVPPTPDVPPPPS
jgi:hypothetical protein